MIAATRVVLRRAAPSDAHELYALARDPEVMRFMDWPMPADPLETMRHLEDAVADWDRGTEHQWVILTRLGGECVGTIACRPSDHAVDFGYFLGRRHWGQGLAAEAAAAMLAWIETQPQIIRIWASADVGNVRSRGLLERLGLQLEGVLRMATFRPNIGGLPRDTAIYGKLTGAHAN
jgi:RimJ/RimL family protein N-acetyltransferase